MQQEQDKTAITKHLLQTPSQQTRKVVYVCVKVGKGKLLLFSQRMHHYKYGVLLMKK
jgi:hypothetical protein